MAVTTKTLSPTNQVVSLPDMTERPNASVLVDGIGKDADAINALSDQMAKQTGSITFDTTYVDTVWMNVVFKRNNIVDVYFTFKLKSDIQTETDIQIGTLPVGFRPTEVREMVVINRSSQYNKPLYLYFKANGEIHIVASVVSSSSYLVSYTFIQ